MKPSDTSSRFVVNQRPFWFFALALVLFGALAVAFGLGGGDVAQDDAAVFVGAIFGGMGLVGVAILLAVPATRT